MMTWIVFFFLNPYLSFAQEPLATPEAKPLPVPTVIQEELKKETIDEKKSAQFKQALAYYQAGQYQQAADVFTVLVSEKVNLLEYAQYYLGRSYLQLNQSDKAEKIFSVILNESPNFKLRVESTALLVGIYIQEKKFKQAKVHLTKIEKRTRGSEQYPEIVYDLAQVEAGMNNHAVACKWAKKLYSRYPAYDKILDWGSDLPKNEIAGKFTNCFASIEDFQNRVRNLMWNGFDQKAQAEIDQVKAQFSEEDKYSGDQLQVKFYLQEGEVRKALDILKPYYEGKKRNFNFLMLFGSAAARAGEVQLAVGSYYDAYKLSPRSKLGRQALYQSAFLSYQFQDYDGAARRFQEFMKIYPTSGLIRDAKWHMAWLKYLKGDYQGAYESFSNLQTAVIKKGRHKVVVSASVERSQYWMAMSLLRQNNTEKAKILFENLAKDKLVGYYSLAAQSRLRKISAQKAVSNKLVQRSNFIPPRMASRFLAFKYLMPSVEEESGDEVINESETEETLVANQYEEPNEDEESDVADNPDSKRIDVSPDTMEKDSPFAGASLTKKFTQARELISLGLTEWARWDLFEIESKTSNKEYMKTLMSEYTAVGHYHRASYIAQIRFGSQRAAKGMDEGRPFWQYAYPRAYSEYVEKYSKNFDIPQELIWGIMRAESQYRRDAISPVGALGLMQVMPFTGHKVASLLGEKTFLARSLLEPAGAVKIGSRYLKRLMDSFQNTIPLVAAGYNAGPHRVKSWLASFGTLEMDEFIEHIPFLETRNYVKKVMSNCQVYSDLYGTKRDIFPYLSNAVPAKIDSENVAKENWDDI